MTNDRRTLLFPILLVTVGTGWLLTTLGIAPGIDWVWTLGLAATGLLPFALSGIDKLTIVFGPLFITASILSVLRQTGRIALEVEIPILVILSGMLMMVARLPAIRVPSWTNQT